MDLLSRSLPPEAERIMDSVGPLLLIGRVNPHNQAIRYDRPDDFPILNRQRDVQQAIGRERADRHGLVIHVRKPALPIIESPVYGRRASQRLAGHCGWTAARSP